MIVFGIIDFGRMLNAQITVTEAAREGARAMALYDQFEGEERVRRSGQNIGTVTPIVLDDCGPNPGPGDNSIMRVEYTFRFATPLGVIVNAVDNEMTLSAEGVMPCIP
jgi:Flp pilus assembly protein TadG